MTRPTSTANFLTPLSHEARQSMSDEERAARGRAQIAAGDCIEDDELDAFLDSLLLPDAEG
jgi:hypothetical protein